MSEILGNDKKRMLLEQIKSKPNQFPVATIKTFLQKFSDISLDDFNGVLPAATYASLKSEAEKTIAEDKWNDILQMPATTDDEIRNALNEVNDYMRRYPQNMTRAQEYYNLLQQKLVEIAGRAEENDWHNLERGSYSALKRYKQKYPNSIHKDDLDDLMWDNAKLAKTPSSIQNYINDWPNGLHIDEARVSLNFFNEWEKAKSEGDIFVVDYYHDNLTTDSPFYYEVNQEYESLKKKELEVMKENPSGYPKDRVDRLLAADIFNKNELIYENLITDASWDVLTMDRCAFPKPEEFQGENFMPPKRDNCTDIYLFGTPGTGKTCLLMGLIGANGNGFTLNTKVGAGEYAAALQEYVNVGFVPGTTNNKWVAAINGEVNEPDKKSIITHNFNLVEMSGEQFAFGLVKNRKNDMASMGLGSTELLKNNNRKVFFIIVDCSNDKIVYKYQEEYKDEEGNTLTRPRKALISQSTILQQFVSLFTLPENQSIMNKVDSIHFVVTKSDLLGDTYEERLEKARQLLLSRYKASIEQLKTYCRRTKRINFSTNYSPHVFTFSLGKFYLGDVFEYDNSESLKIMETIRMITCGVKETTWWDKFKAAIG